MVPHGQENPVFNYTLAVERQVLQDTKALRGVPQKAPGKLLTATWNLTNFGLQTRTDDDFALMAEVISWFDFVAIQEIADDLGHLRALLNHLPASYSVIISDVGGNYERTGFLYDSSPAIVWNLDIWKETAAYKHALKFYEAIPAEKYSALPYIENELVRIPYCLPDDESLLDRSWDISGAISAEPWIAILHDTYNRGELFTLGLHPERFFMCKKAIISPPSQRVIW